MGEAFSSDCPAVPEAGLATWPNATPQPPGGTRINVDCELTYELAGPCELVFLIHAAQGPQQVVVQESLQVFPPVPMRSFTDAHSNNRVLRFSAPAGPLRVAYGALVDRQHESIDPNRPTEAELPVAELPDDVLRFLLPTRYCESDLLSADALQLFGGLPPGRGRVQAVADWVRQHIAYRVGSTLATTTARDVFTQGAGVCRDFAHLAITFCRALNIPARLVSGYARFPEPPTDFHAVFEAYLGGRWVLFDPTGMVSVDQIVRIATGRDAKDVAFATLFGPARMVAMNPAVSVVAAAAAASPATALDPWPLAALV